MANKFQKFWAKKCYIGYSLQVTSEGTAVELEFGRGKQTLQERASLLAYGNGNTTI